MNKRDIVVAIVLFILLVAVMLRVFGKPVMQEYGTMNRAPLYPWLPK